MSRLPLVVRRLLMLLLGVCVTECSSQLFVALGVGADPFMILVQGISRRSGLSYGQLSTLIMLICLVAIFLCAREHIHIGTILCFVWGRSWTFTPFSLVGFCPSSARSHSPFCSLSWAV